MTFHNLFHALSEFSVTKVKQLLSQQYQNNHSLHVFSSIIMHKMCVYFY